MSKVKRKKRNPRKTWENKLDEIFAKIVRKKGFCQRCNRVEHLQCSHIHSRSKMSVRWDLLNAFCLCAGCHLYWWHKHPIEAAEFAKNILGEYNYQALLIRSTTLKRWTEHEMAEHYQVLKGVMND